MPELAALKKPDWLYRAMKMEDRAVRRDWQLDLGGPCRFVSNDWVAVCMRDDHPPCRYDKLDDRNLAVLHECTRDYPPSARWGTVRMLTLRKWFDPMWWTKRKKMFTLDRLLVLSRSRKTEDESVLINRNLVWPLIANLTADEVSIDFDGPYNHVHFTAPGWRIVLMPMLQGPAYPWCSLQHWYAGEAEPVEAGE